MTMPDSAIYQGIILQILNRCSSVEGLTRNNLLEEFNKLSLLKPMSGEELQSALTDLVSCRRLSYSFSGGGLTFNFIDDPRIPERELPCLSGVLGHILDRIARMESCHINLAELRRDCNAYSGLPDTLSPTTIWKAVAELMKMDVIEGEFSEDETFFDLNQVWPWSQRAYDDMLGHSQTMG